MASYSDTYCVYKCFISGSSDAASWYYYPNGERKCLKTVNCPRD